MYMYNFSVRYCHCYTKDESSIRFGLEYDIDNTFLITTADYSECSILLIQIF